MNPLESRCKSRRSRSLREFWTAALACVVAGWFAGSASTAAADDVFDGLARGLVGRYSAGELTRERVDADVAFRWGRAAPFPEFPPGAFTAEWSGTLLVKSDTKYRFSAFAAGRVTIAIGGKTVLEGARDDAGWISGDAALLEFGFQPIRVTYESTGREAACKLYWSSELFPREPLPHHLLFHEEDDAAAELVERGRVLFDAHRCNRCHVRGDSLPSREAPPFIAIAADLNPEWLEAKLLHRHTEAADSKMPVFGFTPEEAEAVGAWLWHINQPPRIAPLRPVEKDKKNPPPDGLTLVRSVGCLACHKLGDLGRSGPYGGGDLSQIGAKRTADWIYTWLLQPDRINPERSMPLFKLSPTERSQIAAALGELGRKPDMSYERPHYENNTAIVQRGRELVRRARCFNCHKTPAVEIDTRGLPTLSEPVADWEQSCLADAPDPEKGRPHYPQPDIAALRAYVETLTHSPPDANDQRTPRERLGEFNHGRLVIERRNCLACHERDGAAGIVETAGLATGTDPHLRGLSEALIPPNLTAVGDKLQDKALAEAVGGDQEAPRLPWLHVRMPKFNHTDEERAALVAYLVGHDRIEAGGPSAPREAPPAGETAAVDSETLLLGRRLVGAGGFSCIACHRVGDYEPRNTAPGTRGSDLKGLAGRMREEFFHRWTRAPLRIVPGMEMPSYEERPAKGVLDGDVQAQLSLLWRALNDPRFEAPTNPSQVEQLLTVRSGEGPRVVRDVFTVSKENGGGYVPRAFAIGFSNGHSLLLDLDRGCMRDWTFGDFARQRTEGKSWYWDLAGAPVVSGLSPRSEFVLRRGDAWIPVATDAGSGLELTSYDPAIVDGVRAIEVAYRLNLPGKEARSIVVRERWFTPESNDGRTCIVRDIRATGLPEGAALYFVPSPFESRLLGAAIELGGEVQPCGELGQGVAIRSVTDGDGASREAARIAYVADAGGPPAEAAPRPELPRNTAPVTTAPGFVGKRLDIPASMMPTGLTFLPEGALAITSLKGHVYLLRDTNRDGLPDSTQEFAAGLAAPFGVLPGVSNAVPQQQRESPDGPGGLELLVVHKPELLALVDGDGDGAAEQYEVRASGWGYTDNYHDWSAGPVRDAAGNLYVATSSDYAQPGRPEELCRWRGKVLRVQPDGSIEAIAHELRYPMGIAFDPQGRLFVSDQQGVANCFNEIDYIVEGARYGVKGLWDPESDQPERRAAVQIPHPWTRSVNGIFFIPADPPEPLAPFAGHGIGCEYNGRFLIRFSLQEVGGDLQGATYLFTRNTWDNEAETFLGPICGGVAPNGDLYVGSIHDSGWLGGLNTGEVVRLRATGERPNGIREIRAIADGFEIEFLAPVDAAAAAKRESYSLSGYTRVWKGSYATEDSGRYEPKIEGVEVSPDRRTVRLHVDRLEPSYVYDVGVKRITTDGSELFPDVGYYTMNRVPGERD